MLRGGVVSANSVIAATSVDARPADNAAQIGVTVTQGCPRLGVTHSASPKAARPASASG